MKKIILFLGVFYAGLVSAQGIEADINAIIEKAKTGNVNAQYTLGGYYFLGSNGVEQSYSKAAYWWEKAAEQGHGDAQFNIGVCYYEGNGIKQSYSKAIYWYKKAAEQGNSKAQFNIGVCYSKGQGVEKSKNNAIYWFRKACNNFDDKACEVLNKIK